MAHLEVAVDLISKNCVTAPNPWQPLPEKPMLDSLDTSLLPKPIRDMAEAVAANRSLPVDLVALSGLGAAAACLTGRLSVCIRNGWIEPCNLFLLGVAPPGGGKSPALSAMTKQLFDDQAAENKSLAIQIKQFKTKREMLETKREKAMKKGDEAEALRCDEELDALDEVKTVERFISGNITPETLARTLADNDGSVALIDSEGELFDILSGRYSDNPSLDAILKGFSGEPLIMKRSSSGNVNIPEANISCLFFTQPVSIERIRRDERMVGRGLLGRFMIIQGAPLEPIGDEPDVPLSVTAEYHALMTRLYHFQKKTLCFTPEARETFLNYRKAVRDNELDSWAFLAENGYTAKLIASTARIAGILAVCDDRGEVTKNDVDRAIQLATTFVNHECALLSPAVILPRTAQEALDELVKRGEDVVEAREIKRKLCQRNAFERSSKRVDEALGILCDRGVHTGKQGR